MANTLKFGNGQWATKEGSTLAYNSENGNFKPLPFDFTRSTSATRVNKQGLIETVGSNEPRIDFLDNADGALKLEPQKTNLITYSELFSTWTSVNSAIASDTTGVISLDGTLNAQLLVSGGTGSVQGIYKNISFLNTTTYTMSVFAKKKEISFIQLQGGGAGWAGNTFANFDLQNGVVGSIGSGAISHSIENYGNGWYRCSFTATKTASGGNLSVDLINSATDGRDAVYNGNIGDGVYLFASQAEQGSYPTSIINTSGSAVTRAAETASQTPPSGIIGQTEGTVFLDFNVDAIQDNGRIFAIGDGGTNNRVLVRFETNGYLAFASTGGVFQWSHTEATLSLGRHKMAIAYALNDVAFYVDGILVNSESTYSVPVTDKFYIGTSEYGGAENTNMKINNSKLYNTRLSNAELAALTQV
jgi:hypothetical protein